MANHWALSVEVEEEHAEALQADLYEIGCLGCEIRDDSTAPMPGNKPPRRGFALVIAYFSDPIEPQEVHKSVAKGWPTLSPELVPVETRDWSNEWRTLIRSTVVGRLWTGPPWESTPAGLIRVAIEPKMAFGTGDHPSTALCLEAINEHFVEFPEDSFLDIGTGSGVLAIAARKLTAWPVIGIDNDSICVASARENAQLNGTTDIEISDTAVDQVTGEFGLVVANILANTLIELAPSIVRRVKRRLTLAGVLDDQRPDVERAYLQLGLRSRGARARGEWVRLDFERRRD